MFKNEGHINIQKITAPEAPHDISAQLLSEILTPQLFETLDGDWYKKNMCEFPDYALLPHVLGRSIAEQLTPEEIDRRRTMILRRLGTLQREYDHRMPGAASCLDTLIWQYLLKHVDPSVPSVLTEREWKRIDLRQKELLERGNMDDYVCIEAWRKLVDRERPQLSDELIQKTLSSLIWWRTEKREKLSDIVVRPTLRKLLFGLKILAPEQIPNDLTDAELRLVTVDYPQPKTVSTGQSTDVYMTFLRRLKEDYAIGLVIASPEVYIDEKGLHVELSESSSQHGKPPTPRSM